MIILRKLMFLKAHTLIRQVHLKSVLLATTDIFLHKTLREKCPNTQFFWSLFELFSRSERLKFQPAV